ncbi:hypothetical protein BpHYR1_040337 [Brachionus plicatilis]|uniref:Uncharacterized protein n=1 Tax=Brachionus plicatilis TaxID=10195 RepID=A0A3M7QFI7_BRAPC|nr:hypothetical protein BpHYR1_040337 [Brachionus plicatilis]
MLNLHLIFTFNIKCCQERIIPRNALSVRSYELANLILNDQVIVQDNAEQEATVLINDPYLCTATASNKLKKQSSLIDTKELEPGTAKRKSNLKHSHSAQTIDGQCPSQVTSLDFFLFKSPSKNFNFFFAINSVNVKSIQLENPKSKPYFDLLDLNKFCADELQGCNVYGKGKKDLTKRPLDVQKNAYLITKNRTNHMNKRIHKLLKTEEEDKDITL